MPNIVVENEWGVIEGLDYAQSRDLEARLNTESVLNGVRLKFKPTRYALDLLVSELGRDAFHAGCRFAWAHLYKESKHKDVDFNWVTDPYDHQREWFSAIKDFEYFALEWEMGLGKSKTILDVMQWAYAQGELDALLVVTLKDVHRKWALEEVPAHLPKGMADAVYWKPTRVEAGMWTGSNARKRESIIKSKKFAVATINFDSLHRPKGEKFCQRFLRSRKCAMVIDESQYIKSPSAKVTRAALRLGKLAERRYILSGTLTPGSPLDAWSQYMFLSPAIVNNMKHHQFKSEFAEETEVPGVTYEGWEYDPISRKSVKVEKPVKTISGFKNLDKMKNMLDPYRSRLLKSDCLDLPDKIYRLRSFQMTPEQNRAYKSMSEEFLVEMKGGRTMTASMAIVKLIRLQQIACGFVVPDDADPSAEGVPGIPLNDKNPRIEALMQEIEGVQNKGIIWASWRYSLREIATALRTAYGDASVVEYHGGIGDDAKTKARMDFQNGKPRWFVANPQSAGVGIDLTAAQDMFYYNNSYNMGLRLQSEDRFHRIGQLGDTLTITDIECLGTVDRPIMRSLKDKRVLSAEVSGDVLKQWLSTSV